MIHIIIYTSIVVIRRYYTVYLLTPVRSHTAVAQPENYRPANGDAAEKGAENRRVFLLCPLSPGHIPSRCFLNGVKHDQ